MRENRKISRYHTGRDMNFHGKDRALTKRKIAEEEYEDLPERESIRRAIFRGPNCFGDNTSFGYYCSGRPKYKYFERLAENYVGKTFSEYYSAMCKIFKGVDRSELDNFVKWNFTPRFRFGMFVGTYLIEDDVIYKYE